MLLRVAPILLAMAMPTMLSAKMPGISLSDTSGRSYVTSDWVKARATVLFFLTTDCPISNSYVPEMNRIAADFRSRGVSVFGVQADWTVSIQKVQQHVREFAYEFPVLLDRELRLARFAGATITPEVVVLSAEGNILYRGKIDNRVEAIGQSRTKATVFYLRNALAEVLSGKPVSIMATTPVGCAIPFRREGPS